MQSIPLAQHSYLDSSQPLSVQRLVNMYLQPKDAQSKSRTALHGTPGLKLFATAGDGPCRGMAAMGGVLYVVSGQECYSVDNAGTATLLGTVPGYGKVGMAHNGTHVVICCSTNHIFSVNQTDFLNLSVTNAIDVAFQDGYLLFAERGSQKMFISALNDATSYDPTEFTLVNANPDNNAGIVNANRETWVFNSETAQVYYNSGAADFPFTRNPSGVVERGSAAFASIAAHMGVVYWLGDDLRVYRSNGYSAQPISTTSIDNSIGNLTSHSGAEAFIYSQSGHVHYVLTFGAQMTICYDITTDRWHERQSYDRNDWRARSHAYVFGKHIVGDAVNGKVYQLDPDTFDEDGDVLRREMVSPPLHAGERRGFMSRFQLDMEFGVGIEGSGQGSDPEIMLDWTDDSGLTWSNELWRKLGKNGKRKWRAVWTRLGSARTRSLRIAMSDPVKAVVIEAYASLKSGSLS